MACLATSAARPHVVSNPADKPAVELGWFRQAKVAGCHSHELGQVLGQRQLVIYKRFTKLLARQIARPWVAVLWAAP